MKKQKATNVVWHSHAVKPEEREKLLKQKGVVMLDIKKIVNDAAAVQKNCDQRLVKCDIEALLALYREKNQLQNDVDGLRQAHNEILAQIKGADNETRPAFIEKSKAIKAGLTCSSPAIVEILTDPMQT